MAPSPRYPAGQPAAAVRPARRNRPGADGGRRPGRRRAAIGQGLTAADAQAG